MRFLYLFMSPDIKMLLAMLFLIPTQKYIFFIEMSLIMFMKVVKVYFMITFNGYFIKMYLTESIN